jgi:predicted  nucleic acid-binding Zn-ribbon protein
MIVGNEMLYNLLKLGPHFKEIFGKNIIVWVSDREKVLGYFPGDDFDIDETSQELASDDPMRIAMEEARPMKTYIPEEMFGVPIKEIDTPVYDENKNVIGCITIGVNLDQETKVAKLSQEMDRDAEKIKTIIAQIGLASREINACERELCDNVNRVSEITRQISEVLAFIQKITSRTNLLGLNAAIESARAGEHGAGFRVVSNEIRMLSVQALETSKKIEKLIKQIETVNSITLQSVDDACQRTEAQEEAVSDVETKISDLKIISEELSQVAKDI